MRMVTVFALSDYEGVKDVPLFTFRDTFNLVSLIHEFHNTEVVKLCEP